ncbi:hypothetical protein D3C73_1330540 [compost metagenome]
MHALIFLNRSKIHLAQRRNAAFETLDLQLGGRHVLRHRITLLCQFVAQFVVVAQLAQNIIQFHIEPPYGNFCGAQLVVNGFECLALILGLAFGQLQLAC